MSRARATYRDQINKVLKACSRDGVEELSFTQLEYDGAVREEMKERKKEPGRNFESLMRKAVMYHRRQRWVVYNAETQSLQITPYGRDRLVALPSKIRISRRQLLYDQRAMLRKCIRGIEYAVNACEVGDYELFDENQHSLLQSTEEGTETSYSEFDMPADEPSSARPGVDTISPLTGSTEERTNLAGNGWSSSGDRGLYRPSPSHEANEPVSGPSDPRSHDQTIHSMGITSRYGVRECESICEQITAMATYAAGQGKKITEVSSWLEDSAKELRRLQNANGSLEPH